VKKKYIFSLIFISAVLAYALLSALNLELQDHGSRFQGILGSKCLGHTGNIAAHNRGNTDVMETEALGKVLSYATN
jgi:hypothetical protein